MKSIQYAMVFSMLATATLGGSEMPEVSGAETLPKDIGLVSVGEIGSDSLERIKQHMEQYLPVPVMIAEGRQRSGNDSLEGEAGALDGLASQYGGLIGILDAPESITQHGAYLPESKTGVVNATALASAEGNEALQLNRLKKESMRCAGLILGLKPCPNTRCAMWHNPNLEGLDFKGGNYCPPCQQVLQNRYEAKPAEEAPVEEASAEAVPVPEAPADPVEMPGF